MIGVLLVNMGSPTSQSEMKYFLNKMFKDRAILPFPLFFRNILATIISNSRYKKSWGKYELIGGSPLKESMQQINEELSKELGSGYDVFTAYSYSQPSIKEGLKYFAKKEIENIEVIPMYPQFSYTTTGSVKTDILKYKNLNINFHESFYSSESFIKYWELLITETISKNNFSTPPLLLFSSHAIPEYHIKNGDTYVEEVQKSAQLISSKLGLDYKVAFQSKIGKVKWVGPDTLSTLKSLSNKGFHNIILIPISFINENLETLYDMDVEFIPFCKKELNFNTICRVEIPKVHPLLIETFKNLILKQD